MIIAVSVLAGLGLIAGFGLALAARFFAVETDPRQEKVLDALPGANCGGCGFAGCSDFAAAVVKGLAPPNGCPVGGMETALKIAEIMGMSADASSHVAKVALVLCQGTNDVAPVKFRYNGTATCASAAQLAEGHKLCSYGCLGFGDCQRACPFGAIEITEGGVARVIRERCTGCGNCVEACPKNLIQLVPVTASVHILCSNKDKGAAARKACQVACIACRKCQKTAGEERIEMDGFLARIKYDNPPDDPALAGECPTGAIVALRPDGTVLSKEEVKKEEAAAASGGGER